MQLPCYGVALLGLALTQNTSLKLLNLTDKYGGYYEPEASDGWELLAQAIVQQSSIKTILCEANQASHASIEAWMEVVTQNSNLRHLSLGRSIYSALSPTDEQHGKKFQACVASNKTLV